MVNIMCYDILVAKCVIGLFGTFIWVDIETLTVISIRESVMM